jgi:hypothetical protein
MRHAAGPRHRWQRRLPTILHLCQKYEVSFIILEEIGALYRRLIRTNTLSP